MAGGNYGWPKAYGFDQSAFNAPLRVYRQPLAPVGGTFVTRPGSLWTGSFVFATLRGAELRPPGLQGRSRRRGPAAAAAALRRLRTVVEGPNGALYVLTSNRDGRGSARRGDDRILRITPRRQRLAIG